MKKSKPTFCYGGYYSDAGGENDEAAKSLGDFILAVQRSDDNRLKSVYGTRKALSAESGTAGGYLVPKDYRAEMLEGTMDSEIVRPLQLITKSYSSY